MRKLRRLWLLAPAPGGSGSASAALLAWLLAIDLVEAAAIVEMRGLGLLPTPEGIVDGYQFERRKLAGVPGGDFRIARTIEIMRDDLLALLGVEKPEVRLGQLARATPVHDLVHHGHGRLGQYAQRRQHDVERVGPELLLCQQRLVFPGEQDVADAAVNEGHRGAARARIQYRHVLVEPAHEILRRGVIAARLLQRPGPRGQVVPARTARALRVGSDDLDAGADQIAPVAQVLRVALAHREHDGRGVGRTVVRQARGPVARYQLRLAVQFDEVIGQRERRNVGLQPIDDGARLLARAAVALVDRDLLAGSRKPLGGKRLV